jgi:cytochrome c oxidase subunit 1
MGGFTAVLSRTVRLSIRGLWTTFVVYFLGTGFAVLATLVGGFGAGWTVLHPLPYHPLGAWSLWSALAMYVGYLFIALAYLLWCLILIVGISKKYGGLRRALAWPFLFSRGRDTSDPLPRPTEILTTVIALAGIVTVLAGAIYLLPLFGEAAGIIGSVDNLFAKNFLFLFGHTLVNSNLYLSAGLVYATLPFYTGRDWKTWWPVALGINLTLILILIPWPHHLYEDFAQPVPLQMLGEIGSYASAMPVFLVTIRGLSLIYRSAMRWSVPSTLMALGLWG